MTSPILPNAQGFALRGYIGGLTLSTAGASATFSVAPGDAADSTNAIIIRLPSSISKTTAAWAVGTGNGALDTGAIANSTWYHVHLIRRPDTGVVDVLISLSATAPTLPANYTQFRRIGSLLTNGTAQWVLFTQLGDEFLWAAAVNNVNTVAVSTTASSVALTVPTGIQVTAHYFARCDYATNAIGLLFSALDIPDQAPGGINASLIVSSTATVNSGEFFTRTNTSGQIRVRASNTGPSYSVTSIGWIDTRGRFS